MPASPRAVQMLLQACYGSPVVVERWERLRPWCVARAVLRGGCVPDSVIVKWLRTDSSSARRDVWRLRAEIAALRFLAEDLGLDLAPRVIAADMGAGFIVMEDLAPRVALDRLIRRDGPMPTPSGSPPSPPPWAR